ncbi:MAG: SAM-dependent methyltransferase [Hyphomicrobiaceae bacterium]|nr:SAM-dependent methyltransferase [Hyphomicrobiaceae bacterium]
MDYCLQDLDFGYYRSKTALGASGDFITAPDISQLFGELIGLWAVVVWKQMGEPDRFNLVELGAGRGTLLKDALRAARLVAPFLSAAHVHVVEVNPILRHHQEEALGDFNDFVAAMQWHDEAAEVSAAALGDQPTILIANEFLDTFPPEQYVRKDAGWLRRGVTLGEDNALAFTAYGDSFNSTEPVSNRMLDNLYPTAQTGDIVERTPFAYIPCDILDHTTCAALFIDYGHTEPTVGDTLQAVREHKHEHPLTSPGEADLTVQVDFSQFANDVRQRNPELTCDGPITQAEFLGRLGIVERASMLMDKNPSHAAAIEAAVARLITPQGMGTRFKAIGVRSKTLPPLPAFE